ncbi:DoxX family protein [Pirellulaceae bacterium SH449]
MLPHSDNQRKTTMQSLLSLTGRIMITLIFLMSAIGNKIPNFSAVTKYMASEGVPFPSVMLVGAILFLIIGSLSIVTGYRIRIGAGMLLVFLVLATYFFHDFWNFEGEASQQQMIQFLKNLSLMGTMVFLMANGGGACCLPSKQKPEPLAS